MIKIRVPATSANMGPGFDSLGIALSLYSTYYIEASDTFGITGCEEKFRGTDNLVYTSMKRLYDETGIRPENENCKINICADIPPSRGLGSSAGCVAAGLMAANILSGANLTKDELLEIGTMIEGHPDNITPAFLGGMTVAVGGGGKVTYQKINIPSSLRFCAMIPDFRLDTSKSRSVLPDMIKRQDAVYNASRSAMLVAAFSNNDLTVLGEAFGDKLHQNYRFGLIPDSQLIMDEAIRNGAHACYLSGAGSTIMAVIDEKDKHFEEKIKTYSNTLTYKWDITTLKPDYTGAFAEEI